MPGLEHSWAHGGHFWAHVGAIMAPSATLEWHWVAQGAQSDEVTRWMLVKGGQCWWMLVNVKGQRQGRGP